MITIEQKREACIRYETDWLQSGADRQDMEYIMRDGWIKVSRGCLKTFYQEDFERFYKEVAL